MRHAARLVAQSDKAQQSALAGLARLADADREEVARLAKRIVAKVLHRPLSALKEEARRGNAPAADRSARRLFGL